MADIDSSDGTIVVEGQAEKLGLRDRFGKCRKRHLHQAAAIFGVANEFAPKRDPSTTYFPTNSILQLRRIAHALALG